MPATMSYNSTRLTFPIRYRMASSPIFSRPAAVTPQVPAAEAANEPSFNGLSAEFDALPTYRDARVARSQIIHRWIRRCSREISKFLVGWLEHLRTRHALAGLDDRMLRDIGLSRDDLRLETSKPYWHV